MLQREAAGRRPGGRRDLGGLDALAEAICDVIGEHAAPGADLFEQGSRAVAGAGAVGIIVHMRMAQLAEQAVEGGNNVRRRIDQSAVEIEQHGIPLFPHFRLNSFL